MKIIGPISEETIKKILELNKEGKKHSYIAKELNIHKSTVSRYLKKFGVYAHDVKNVKWVKNITTKEKGLIISRYLAGESCIRISKDYGVSSPTLYRFLRKENINIYRYISKDKTENIIKLIKKGWSIPSITKEVGVSATSTCIFYNRYTTLFEKYLRKFIIRSIRYNISKNIETDLTTEYLKDLYNKQEGKCFYTGIEMVWQAPKSDRRVKMSVDRLIPEGGYVKGNVVFCTHAVNTAKNDFTLEELSLLWKPEIIDKINKFLKEGTL